MSRYLLPLVFLLPTLKAYSQTFTGEPGIFHLNDTTVFDLNVSGLIPQNINYEFGVEQIMVSLNCENTGLLLLTVISPDNTEIVLTNRCTTGEYFINTGFKDDVYYFINEGWNTYSGLHRPDDNIGYFNNGQIANGTWKLKIINDNSSDGYLDTWNISFSDNPSEAVNFDNSNLPIILIETDAITIPDDPKIPAMMHIIDNGTGNQNHLTDIPVFEGNIGIELRGSSSQSFLKKSYGLTTYNASGGDLNVSLFGMPEESDWVLIANYSDKSLIRNALTFELARQTGRYASRTRFIELFINGKYRGVYQFSEKLKRDAGRIDISKLEPDEITGDDLTGGYILKIDKTTGGDEGGFVSPFLPLNHSNGQYIYFQYEYPDGDDIVPEQESYIESYVVDSFETVLNSNYYDNPEIGYRKYADEFSFMDFFYINEISKNIDGYRLSTFIHKDKYSNGGKLKAGPVWDFDLAWRNADYYGGDNYSGWVFESISEWDWWQVPFWWSRFLSDENYGNSLNNRWLQFRQNVFSQENIFTLIDSMRQEINQAQTRNFEKWNILGRYVWPNPEPIAQTYNEEITNMKLWIQDRLIWMDNALSEFAPVINNESKFKTVYLYPNPCFSDNVHISNDKNLNEINEIKLMDMNGKILLYKTEIPHSTQLTIPVSNLKNGIYFISIKTDSSIETQKLIIY